MYRLSYKQTGDKKYLESMQSLLKSIDPDSKDGTMTENLALCKFINIKTVPTTDDCTRVKDEIRVCPVA